MTEKEASLGTKLQATVVAHVLGLPMSTVLKQYCVIPAGGDWDDLAQYLVESLQSAVDAALNAHNN